MHRLPFIFFVALLFVPRAAWPQGDPLGPEFRVNTYTTSDQGGSYSTDHPVAVDPSGNFVVVWGSQDGSGRGIFGQRHDSSGTPLGLEFRINTHTLFNQAGPSVAADSSGKFVVVWESYGQEGGYPASPG